MGEGRLWFNILSGETHIESFLADASLQYCFSLLWTPQLSVLKAEHIQDALDNFAGRSSLSEL